MKDGREIGIGEDEWLLRVEGGSLNYKDWKVLNIRRIWGSC